MKVLEQTTHKGFEISHWWKERIFNINTNRVDYAIIGVYQDVPKSVVILGSYWTEHECDEVFENIREAQKDHADKFIMPDREWRE